MSKLMSRKLFLLFKRSHDSLIKKKKSHDSIQKAYYLLSSIKGIILISLVFII